MALQETNTRTQEVTTLYMGRVVEIRTYVDRRNHSDTLDYSDYRDTNITEALVYVGRRGPKSTYDRLDSVAGRRSSWSLETDDVDLEVQARFAWVDCTNLFVWRGSDHREATVDAEAFDNAELVEDFAAWKAYVAEQVRLDAERRIASAKAEKERREEEERNRPVKGKRMEVFKGRKVPVGTVGIAAFIHANGGVLLKNEDEWQDRKAQGIWVNTGNLRAFRPCDKHDDCKACVELAEACAQSTSKRVGAK